jgi:hypothetical protein
MSWFTLTRSPFVTLIMFITGLAAIYFRQQIAAWLFKHDSSHVSRDEKYAQALRQSFVYWSAGTGIFLILNTVLNITGPIHLS